MINVLGKMRTKKMVLRDGVLIRMDSQSQRTFARALDEVLWEGS
jgi:hypothetical protein